MQVISSAVSFLRLLDKKRLLRYNKGGPYLSEEVLNLIVVDYLLSFAQILLLSLGVILVCGFAVRFFSFAFARISGTGSGDIFDITSIIGTPVHELGHAVMCLLFGHKIKRIKLWSPRHEDGVYGFVEHTYNRKNPWARLGCLFIGVGPIFSGLGVIVLVLLLCFPAQWSAYLDTSRALMSTTPTIGQITSGAISLLRDIIVGFGDNWVKSLIGILIILPVSLHITLSWQDIKSASAAAPLYLLIVALVTLCTMLFKVSGALVGWLWLWNLRALSLFCIVIAFSAVWVVLALLVRLVRIVISWF